LTGALNERRTASVPVSSTPDIWSGAGNSMYLTGSGTITGFTNAPQLGSRRTLLLQGATTLINSNTMVVYGGTMTLGSGDFIDVWAEEVNIFHVTVRRRNGLSPVAPTQIFDILGTATVSSPVAQIDFLTVFSSTYDFYIVELSGLSCDAERVINLRVARSGTVDTSSNYSSGPVNGPYSTGTAMVLHNSAGVSRISGEVRIIGTAFDSPYMTTEGSGVLSGGQSPYHRQGVSLAAGLISGFRIYPTSGTFTAGSVRVYGIRNVAGVM
jgi:hypothetical protein